VQGRARVRGVTLGLAVITTTVGLALLTTAGGAAAGGAAQRTELAGGPLPYATKSHELRDARGTVAFSVALRWRHEAQLDRFNAAVADPANPRYAHYLSPARFNGRFAPTTTQVRTVRAWLEGQGLKVTGVSANRMLLDATGNVGQIDRAFGTSLRVYRARGQNVRAAAKPISVPSRLAGTVLSVVGLDESWYSPATDSVAPPGPATRSAGPCSRFWGAKYAFHKPPAYGSNRPWAVCGYRPRQFQSAYGVRQAIKKGRDGSGQRIAVVDAFESPTLPADLREYSRRHGLEKPRITIKRFHGCQTQCDDASQQTWYREQSLDVEAAHTMAPGARIMYIGAADPFLGLFHAVNWVVEHRTAHVVTNSYGSPDAVVPRAQIVAQEQTAKQAIAEGIGLYFSTGDFGDWKSQVGYVTTQYPASSPHVTAMGGTTTGIGPRGNLRFETAWGLHAATLSGGTWSPTPPGPFSNGGSGGTTRLFAEPGYQKGVVPGRLTTRWGSRGRVLPDISMDGDPTTGMLIGQTQTFPDGSTHYNQYNVGGTSLASPLFAGYMALADQAAGFHHGFVNPALYRLSGGKPIRDVRAVRTNLAQIVNLFNNGVDASDGITTKLATGDMDSSLKATKGYDNATGLGSPRGRQLIRALKRR
jgi:subtilase family serine protease